MRYAVLGNCQAVVLADHLKRVCPAMDVRFGLPLKKRLSPEDLEACAAELETYDCVITQKLGRKDWGPLNSEELSARVRHVVYYPTLHFTGLQPDAIHVSAKLGLITPLGSWQPGITLASFILGLPEQRAVDLYNAYIFGVLGYFDEYDKSVAFHRMQAAQIDFDLDFERWKAAGSFFHLPHHPKAFVTQENARQVCAKLGLDVDDGVEAGTDALDDTPSWPVHSAIAARLGIAGGETFLAHVRRPVREMSIGEVVEDCYAAYRANEQTVKTMIPRAREIAERLRAEGV